MANIVLSFTDPKHGIVSTTFQMPDQDMARLYAAYKDLINPPQDDGGPHKEINDSEVCDYLASYLLNTITSAVYNQEITMLARTSGIKYLNASVRQT